MNKIYALHDPLTMAIRYVGKTKSSLDARLRGHLQDANRYQGVRRFAWIIELRERGLQPAISLLEEVDDWRVAEQKWIKSLRASGCALLNATSGGDGPEGHAWHTAKSRQTLSDKAKHRYADPDYRAKMGEAVRQAYKNPQAKLNLSSALKVAFAKPEVKARLSAAQKISCAQPELRALRRKIYLGKIVSDETKRKISDAKKGKKLTPQHAANMAAGHRGLKQSAETIAKRSAWWGVAEKRQAAIQRLSMRKHSAEERRNQSAVMKKLWEDRRAGLASMPNAPRKRKAIAEQAN